MKHLPKSLNSAVAFDLVMLFISKPCMCPWVDLDCFCIRYLVQMLQVKSCHSFGWITPFYCNLCDCLFPQRLPAPICGMTSSNGRIFRVTGHLCGEFTDHRWIPRINGQWRRALIISLIYVWISGRVNNYETGDLRRYCANHSVIVMVLWNLLSLKKLTPSRNPPSYRDIHKSCITQRKFFLDETRII